MGELNKKVRAFTLLESLVALTILMISLGFAATVYTKTLSSDKQRNRFKAQLIVESEAIKTLNEGTYIDSQFKIDDLVVYKTVERYDLGKDLFRLIFIVKDMKDEIIYERDQIIFMNETF